MKLFMFLSVYLMASLLPNGSAVAEDNLNFFYHCDTNTCVNQVGQAGVSTDYFGECGKVIGQDYL